MKKFLSAVTSVCMGISVLASSFAVPLSTLAAGGEYPAGQSNVALNGAGGVTANKQAESGLTWKVDDVSLTRAELVDNGGYVVVPVRVSQVSDQMIAGAAFTFSYADELTWEGGEVDPINVAYANCTNVLNETKPKVNFACPQKNPNGGRDIGYVCTEQGAVIIELVFSLPTDVPDGKYDIDMFFEGNDRAVADNNNTTAEVTLLGGSVTIGDPAETTTTSATTTTTTTTTKATTTTTKDTTATTKATSATTKDTTATTKATSATNATETSLVTTVPVAQDGEIAWIIPDVKAKPGDTVTMDVAVQGEDIAVAGMEGSVNVDKSAGIALSKVSDESAGYSARIAYNVAEELIAFDTKSAFNVKASDGSTVFSLTYTVPTDCKSGKYPVTWGSNMMIVDENGLDVTKNVKLVDGSITIEAPQAQEGEISWIIPDVEAEPGDTVNMNVTVSGDVIGVAGMEGAVNVDGSAGIALADVSTESAGYSARVVSNVAEELIAFDTKSAFNVKAADGSEVFTLTYTVPDDCKAGKYPVTWGDIMIVDENGLDVTKNVKLVDGSITIKSVSTIEPQAGEISWVIPDVEAEPGDTVNMSVTVEGDVIGVAGMEGAINVDGSAGIALSKVSDESTGYSARVVYNVAEELIAFDTKSAFNVKAADGSEVFTLTYTVPEDCKAGKYPVTWGDIMVVDENGLDVTKNIKLVDGSITIKAESTTTIPAQKGEISWIIPDVEAEPGDTVNMSVTVKGDVIGVAGMDGAVNVDGSAGIALSKVSDESTGYSARVVYNVAEELIAFDTKSAFNVKAADGSEVFTLTYTVPEDCKAGKYPVTWGDIMVVDENGLDVTKNIKLVDGSITIKAETTTTLPVQTGEISWVIPEVQAKAGDTVNMSVTVEGDVIGVAGMDGAVNVDGSQGIKLSAVSDESTGYSARVVYNVAEELIAFDTKSAFNVKAADGSEVFTLTYTVPEDCKAGKYPVTWGDIMVVDENGLDVTKNIKLVDGFIEIVDETTTTTTTTNTTTTTTTTTTLPAGEINWDISEVTAKPGDTVQLPVIVNGTDVAVAGMEGAVNVDGSQGIKLSAVSE
ncbi:MAG: cohesin domain-containing protein, partial [Oscillospiraceae bacterium]|nr:cohesin domain-containing protein [Oscillospiraceae bacterium]